MSILNEISELVIKGDIMGTKAKVAEAVDQKVDATSILNDGLMPGINEIGERFAKGQIFVPNVLLSAKAMNTGVEVIQPLLAAGGDTTIGTAVVATVKGDLHDIGKNLVALMMKSVNLKVIDLGANVSAEKFVEAINEYHPDIVGLSALLTTTMNEQGHVIEVLKEAGVRDQVKVMIGGAPVTQGWADKIGADAFTADAAEASRWAKTYCTSIR
ncbi:corrinoid protein [Lawsonibacter faecis]|uniref:Corrinoid protein n=1 Tax=Lawsonibacter faecis TaxID=2763052 RepID=A0A8J6JM88_9FIRM|nr:MULTISPECIES: corrinoid protein [Oscillospiraceae]MTQ98306.1 cobalamin-binding protein [Pseudoflavonifractor sp. BIOML-A16]MTR07653.1 cobalamin-binding protein [Pseudoflavonifractor sp. BIOML-A15]MTR74566.1 cobalamin-binding protein [Pseudoflavonifractor sp. BIOML-A18]MTS65883.1 cobalamin-binding protein [Pseudoflavonifractor sp. BIOML-A5]MTS73115.1 cobalamin-binding protein [Pseudoflavonifractor sp. BIOML-A8]MTS92480.1 cobalamin-binding protein [Pseudoflavonifractor sp. BIOML-A4]